MGSGSSKKTAVNAQQRTQLAKEHKVDNTQTSESRLYDQGELANHNQKLVAEIPHPFDEVDLLSKYQEFTRKVIYEPEEKKPVKTSESIKFFAEFPTPTLLREANWQYAELRKAIERDSEGVVEPYPVASSKHSVFNLEKYQDLDLHSVQAPQNLLQKSLQALVDYLVRPAKSEVQRARVLYCWLAAQNLALLDVTTAAENTVLSKLKKLENNQLSYNRFYMEMCQLSDLKCYEVEGYVKGRTYKPGEKPGEDHYGSWCAVLLDDVWRFVDALWGSCHAVENDDGEWELIDDRGTWPTLRQMAAQQQPQEPARRAYKRNEFYFLPNPEEFIYTHLPQLEKWQLLARPVTDQEFQEMAFLTPPFFDLNLRLLDHCRSIQYSSNGEIDIQVGLPEEERRFLYRLWISTADLENQSSKLGEVSLKRFVFMEYRGDDDFVNFRVIFPVVGKFKLELFSKADTYSNSNTFNMVCSYIIICDEPKQDCKPSPENKRGDWGPGPDTKKAGLKPVSHKRGLVECEDGAVEMKFKQERDVDILAKLTSSFLPEKSLQNCTLNHKKGKEIVLNVKVPDRGEFALSLYAKDADGEGLYSSICTYLLTSDTAALDTTSFPTILNETLGSTARNKDLGVELVSPTTPLIEVDDSGEVEIVLRADTPMSFSSSLVYQSGKTEIEIDDMCLRTTEGSRTTLRIQCPQAGTYAFVVYGKKKAQEGDSLPCLYKFLLRASNPKQNCLPFPRTYPTWDDGCKLIEPETGLLSAGQTVPVAVQIPEAKDVAVIAGDKWFHLERADDGTWRGEAETGEEGEVRLSAKMEENTTTYNTFASFQVKEEKALKQEKQRQQEAKKKAQQRAKQKADRKRKRDEDLRNARRELEKAMADRDVKKLREALRVVERKHFITSIQQLVFQSRALLQSLERIEKLRITILKMDSNTMLEIRRYTSPPPLVHEVMMAALLLLGDHEELTREWTECQKLCNTLGATGLNKRVRDFKVERLHPEIAARAKQILQRVRVDEVKAKSSGAGTFYVWTIGMINELHALQKKSKRAQPADVARQKKILVESNRNS